MVVVDLSGAGNGGWGRGVGSGSKLGCSLSFVRCGQCLIILQYLCVWLC